MTKKTTPTKHQFRPRSRAMALEPRVLFDGAAVVAGADFVLDASHKTVPEAVATVGMVTATAVAEKPAQEKTLVLTEPTTGTAPLATDLGATHALVVVDSRVSNYQSLLTNLPSNSKVLVVNANESGLDAMNAALSQGGSFSSVHIFSHGSAGSFTLGSDTVDNAHLNQETAKLQALGSHLTKGADILIYGCDVAQGTQGAALVSKLATITNADVAASTNLTGSTAQGGDWVLESQSGFIEAKALSATGLGETLAAPTITDSITALRTVAQGSSLMVTGITIADADTLNSQTVTITAANGKLTLASTAGLTGVSGNGTGSVSFVGSAADATAAINGMAFTPDSTFFNDAVRTGVASFTVNSTDITPITTTTVTTAPDGTTTTTTTTQPANITAQPLTATVVVTPINHAPDFSTQAPVQAVEGGATSLSLAQLATSASALDVDIANNRQVLEQLMVKIVSLPDPAKGYLSYNGSELMVGSVVPATQLSSVSYVHVGGDLANSTTDSFNITVNDGAEGVTAGTITINVAPKNVEPTINSAPVVIEGQVKTLNPHISWGDTYDNINNATSVVLSAFNAGGQGTFFWDANSNNQVDAGEELTADKTLTAAEIPDLGTKFKYLQDGTEPNAPTPNGVSSPSYTIQVTDGGGGAGLIEAKTSAATHVTLTVNPNNDDPTLFNEYPSSTDALPIAERSVTVLTPAMLEISDGDWTLAGTHPPANQLVYTLGTRPTEGELQLNVGGTAGPDHDGWAVMGDGARFTQEDVIQGRVRYYQTREIAGGVIALDKFTFTVRDSAFGYDVWTNPASDPAPNGREGGLRNALTDTALATQEFHFKITGTDSACTGYVGAPRLAGDLSYTFTPTSGMTDGNSASDLWLEANVGAPDGGYVITTGMLSYTITRTDTISGVAVVVPANETVYTLTAQAPNGDVQIYINNAWHTLATNSQFTQADIDAGNIRFVHDGSENHVSNFGYTVSDGTPHNYPSTFSIDTNPTNDRPTTNGGVERVVEGTGNSVRLNASVIGMGDVDLSQQIAKRVGEGAKDFLWFKPTTLPADTTPTEHGKLQRWDGAAWVDVTVNEWLPQSLLEASVDDGTGSATSGLRYVHDGSEPLTYAGGSRIVFNYVVRDDLAEPATAWATDTSAPAPLADTSPQSNVSAEATAIIKVIAVNNPPMIADKPADTDPTIAATITNGGALVGANQILNVDEGSTAVITSSFLAAVDPDSTTVQRQYLIKSVPTTGQLLLNGATIGVGSTFTQADIDAGLLTYQHNGSEVGDAASFPSAGGDGYNDKFHFVVDDAIVADQGTGAPNYNTFLITLAPANDRPVVTAPSASVVIDSVDPANNPVTGFSVADTDFSNGTQTGETDFVQVTVRLLDSVANNTPVTDYTGVTLGCDTPATPSALWAVMQAGNASILQIQGTRADVNTALQGLKLAFATDLNKDYKLQVIADDRMRDSTGALTGGANGGAVNQATTVGGASTPVPSTAYNWITDAVPTNDSNIDAKTVTVRASVVNEPATLTSANAVTVLEDVLSPVAANFTISDPESAAFGSPVKVTLNVLSGTLDIGSGTAGVDTSLGNVSIAGDTTNTVTLTGKASDIQAVLNTSLYYKTEANVNHDWNGADEGDVSLTVSFDDTGSTYGGDTGAGSQPNNPADLVVPITIDAINDAPVVDSSVPDPVPVLGNTATAIQGLSVIDIDSEDGYADGESNGLIQVTVRLLPESNATPLTEAQHQDITFSSTSAGATVVDTNYNGNGKALVIRGTLEDVNTYLAGLQITVAESFANSAAYFRVQVIADDRLHTADGALDGSGKANGGLNIDSNGSTASVPSTVVDPYGVVPSGLTQNVAEVACFIKTNSLTNEAPVLHGLDATPTHVENGPFVVLDDNATITDPELTPHNNWDGAVLTLQRNGGVNAEDQFSLPSNSAIASVTNAGGKLEITFNSDANDYEVNAVLQSIAYRNTNDNPPANVTIDYTISDGDTDPDRTANPQGNGGALTHTGSITVTLVPANDAPVVVAPANPVNIDSAIPALNRVLGFSVSDPDLTDTQVTDEVDFVQATVRLLDANGAPVTDYSHIGTVGGGVTFGYASPADTTGLWKVTQDGTNNILQLQGTRAQVNTALAGLTATFENNQDAVYQIQVIADDRVRAADGTLDTSGRDANGGEVNQAAVLGDDATAVPSDEYDWLTQDTLPNTDPNIRSATVTTRPSSVNDTTVFTGPVGVPVQEDVRTLIGGDFAVADPESTGFHLPIKVTLSVPSGQGTLDIAGTGAQTSFTPAGGSAVAIAGDGTRTVSLTGLPADIQALLNAKNASDATVADANGGVYYISPKDGNHDYNGVGVDGDVTLTTSFDEQSATIGGNIGAGSVVNVTPDIVTAVTIDAINDAPVVAASTAPLVIAADTVTAVGGFAITDVDSNNGYATGETDGTVQVIVRVLDGASAPLGAAKYAEYGIKFNSTANVSSGAAVDSSFNGDSQALKVRGTLTQVNDYLAGLTVQFSNRDTANLDANYQISVVADDRLRDASGALAVGANGGEKNQQTGTPTVPTKDTFDPYSTTTTAAYGVYNVVANTRTLFISTLNNPGKIAATDVTVDENAATLDLTSASGSSNISVTDTDDNATTTMTTTVTVSKGTITAVGGTGGTVSATLGTDTITITGATKAQINSRLQALTVSFPADAGADWNGNLDVTVVYNDAGNTGLRPDTLTGGAVDATTNPGSYSYFDPASSTDNQLVTTRTFKVTVNPVNDAPTATANATTLTATIEDVAGGVGITPAGDTIDHLFGTQFSDAKDEVVAGSHANHLAGVAITTNRATTAQGVWEYTTDATPSDTTVWAAFPAVSEASPLLLKATDSVRFIPTANYFGTPGSLDARLVDDSTGAVTTGVASVAAYGGTTAYSTDVVTLKTIVNPANDSPTIAAGIVAAVAEDANDPAGAVISTLNLHYSDAADNQTTVAGGGNTATPIGGIAIVGNAADAATQGVWQYNNGSGWVTVGTPSDAAAIVLPTTASLRFLPKANFNGTPDGLMVRTADTTQSFEDGVDISAAVANPTSTWSAAKAVGTTVNPVNDAPELTHTAANPTATENSSTGVAPSIDPVALLNAGDVSDMDLSTTAGLTAGTFGAGKITVSLTDGIAGDVLQVGGTLPAGVSVAGGSGSTALVITLDNDTTTAEVKALLESIQYKNTSDNPTTYGAATTRHYTVVLNDGINTQANGNSVADAGGSALAAPTISGTITLVAANDPPVGVNDSNVVTEDSSTNTVTGNALTGVGSPNSTADSDPDNLASDLSLSGIRSGTQAAASGTVSAITAGTTHASGGSVVSGLYGTLTIGSDGSYSYLLNNDNSDVNALLTGQTLHDVFTYTLRDSDNAANTAEIDITINGHTDNGTVLQIVPNDGNGAAAGHITVYEAGLTSVADVRETTTGQLMVDAPSGIQSITIGGTAFSVAQLKQLSVANPSTDIDTGKGILKVTGITPILGSADAPTSAEVNYTYTLKAAVTNAAPSDTESTDTISLVVTENTTAAATGTGDLVIQILDDVPTANPDTDSIAKGSSSVAGNAFANDRIGADVTATPVTAITGGAPGTPANGAYGAITLVADGSYTYALDNTNADVVALQSGQKLTDTFTYTITDADGDTSTATITVTINGVAPVDVPVVVDPPPQKPTVPVVVEPPAQKPTVPVVVEQPVPVVVEPPAQKPTVPVVVEQPVQEPTVPVVVEPPAQKPTVPVVVEQPVQEPTVPVVVDPPPQKPTVPVVVEPPAQKPTVPVVVEPPPPSPLVVVTEEASNDNLLCDGSIESEIEGAQRERERSDRTGTANPCAEDMPSGYEAPSRMPLGKDRSVWIHDEVVRSQNEGSFLRNPVHGHCEDIDLSADGLIPVSGFVAPTTRSGAEDDAPRSERENDRDEDNRGDSDKGAEKSHEDTHKAPESIAPKHGKTTAVDRLNLQKRSAPSFTAQLQKVANRLPVASGSSRLFG